METYFTIKESKEAELTEQRSRFLSYVSPAANKDEADAFLDKIRAMHPQATHCCWAYQVGAPDSPTSYYSDDGEPSGTAGQPILQSLKQKELQNVVLAVVRYFGGIKLGVRGLIDTYRAAAELVLAETERVKKQAMEEIPFSCPYSFYNTLLYKTEKLEGRVENAVFGEIVQGRAVVPRTAAPQIKAFLEEIKHS